MAATEWECEYARSLGLTDDEVEDEIDKLVDYRVQKPGMPWRTWCHRAADWKRRHPSKPKSFTRVAAERVMELRREIIREGGDPDAPYVDPDAEARKADVAAQAKRRKKNGPAWPDILAVIRRKTFGVGHNQAAQNFRKASFRRGVLEIAVFNGHLYPNPISATTSAPNFQMCPRSASSVRSEGWPHDLRLDHDRHGDRLPWCSARSLCCSWPSPGEVVGMCDRCV